MLPFARAHATEQNHLRDQGLQIISTVDFFQETFEIIVIMVISLGFEIGHIVLEPTCFLARLKS